MATIDEDYRNQTTLRVKLDGGDLEEVIAEYAAKVSGCSLLSGNVKVESVRVREVDRSQHRYSATAEVSLVILHTPGAIDAWVERREQEAVERRAEIPLPPPTVECSPRYRLRFEWKKHLNLALAAVWGVWAVAITAKVF